MITGKEKDKLATFCKHPKWNVVVHDITCFVTEYVRLKRKLRDLEEAFPLDVGRFTLKRNYDAYDSYGLVTGEDPIYGFSVSSEPVPNEEPADEEAKRLQRNFMGATVGSSNPTKTHLVTHVYMVAWKSLFALEEFLKAVKGIISRLEADLEFKQAEDQDEATEFDDYLEGASELLDTE